MPLRTEPLTDESRLHLRRLARARDRAQAALDRAHTALNDALVTEYAAGSGLADIGEEVGLTKARVHQIVKAARNGHAEC